MYQSIFFVTYEYKNLRITASETRRERKQNDRKYENNMRSDRHNPPSPCGVTDCPNATDSYGKIKYYKYLNYYPYIDINHKYKYCLFQIRFV